MQFTNFIFDLDGPLLDGKQRHYQCYKQILKELNCEALNLDEYWQMKRERRNRHEQLAATGAQAHYEEFLRRWLERIEAKEYLALDILQPDAVTVLTLLQQQKKCLILATLRHNTQHLYEQLDKLNIRNFFQHIVAVNSQNSADKAGAVQAILQGQNAATLWIGDTEVDSQSANKLGFPVALVANGLRTREYLADLSPQYSGDNLTEVFTRLSLST